MTVEFLEKFSKDIDRINQPHIKSAISKAILKVELAKNISEIHNLKKLSGHKSAYRIRIGDYRIGIFISGHVIQFARVVHRKDVYDVFP